MSSLKNQHAPILIVYPRPNSKSGIQEDFCSFEFRDAPLLIYHCDHNPVDEENDNRSPYTPITFPLVWCNYKITDNKWCAFCCSRILNTSGYYSTYGELDKRIFTDFWEDEFTFHIECIKPMENNSYHPKHSLQILMFANAVVNTKVCYCCYQDSKKRFYYCSICNFSICDVCAREPLLTIDHKKRHEHTLSYIPREASMTCDVCALDNRRYFIYYCHKCDFVVHKECIYSPSIIKISRHEHRLSFTYSLGHGNWFCGVCHKKYDENYGGYSCVKDCGYVVHSRCATEGYLWDRKELEGVPENAYEDITPFKVISDGIIQHFSHSHHMRLHHQEIDKLREESICCQVCALRIYDGDVFSCMECDFVLHKACAYLPLKKDHPTHPHPLVLKPVYETLFMCHACHRACNSFAYVCKGIDGDDDDAYCFVLDVHCALISEPLDHHCHPHLLFLPYKTDARICSICKRNIRQSYRHLDCEECGFVLCFSCATLPKKFVYKHDEHTLIFSYEQDVSDQYWCDVCEEEAYLKNGVYMCNDCDITLHVECLFGGEMFMLPGKKIITECGETFLNNRLTRYICARCHKRCHQNKVFYGNLFDKEIYCSLVCLFDYNYLSS